MVIGTLSSHQYIKKRKHDSQSKTVSERTLRLNRRLRRIEHNRRIQETIDYLKTNNKPKSKTFIQANFIKHKNKYHDFYNRNLVFNRYLSCNNWTLSHREDILKRDFVFSDSLIRKYLKQKRPNNFDWIVGMEWQVVNGQPDKGVGDLVLASSSQFNIVCENGDTVSVPVDKPVFLVLELKHTVNEKVKFQAKKYARFQKSLYPNCSKVIPAYYTGSTFAIQSKGEQKIEWSRSSYTTNNNSKVCSDTEKKVSNFQYKNRHSLFSFWLLNNRQSFGKSLSAQHMKQCFIKHYLPNLYTTSKTLLTPFFKKFCQIAAVDVSLSNHLNNESSQIERNFFEIDLVLTDSKNNFITILCIATKGLGEDDTCVHDTCGCWNGEDSSKQNMSFSADKIKQFASGILMKHHKRAQSFSQQQARKYNLKPQEVRACIQTSKPHLFFIENDNVNQNDQSVVISHHPPQQKSKKLSFFMCQNYNYFQRNCDYINYLKNNFDVLRCKKCTSESRYLLDFLCLEYSNFDERLSVDKTKLDWFINQGFKYIWAIYQSEITLVVLTNSLGEFAFVRLIVDNKDSHSLINSSNYKSLIDPIKMLEHELFTQFYNASYKYIDSSFIFIYLITFASSKKNKTIQNSISNKYSLLDIGKPSLISFNQEVKGDINKTLLCYDKKHDIQKII